MKISELIFRLQTLLEEHGDQDVMVSDGIAKLHDANTEINVFETLLVEPISHFIEEGEIQACDEHKVLAKQGKNFIVITPDV